MAGGAWQWGGGGLLCISGPRGEFPRSEQREGGGGGQR